LLDAKPIYLTLFGKAYFRFKSHPARDHLLFPCTTPSGFNIGTILKIKLFLN